MRHFAEEPLTCLGHRRLLFGGGTRSLCLDPIGHIPFVQQDADPARHRIKNGAAIDMVPTQSLLRHHPVHLCNRQLAQRRIQKPLSGIRVMETLDQAHAFAVGRECTRIGKHHCADGIKQADRAGRVTQCLDGAALLDPYIGLGRLKQQHITAVIESHG